MTTEATTHDSREQNPQQEASAAEKAMKQSAKTQAESDGNAPNGPNDGPELTVDTQPPPSTAPADPSVAKRGA